jgi:hypothetical protein
MDESGKGGAMSKDIEDIGSIDDVSGFDAEADKADARAENAENDSVVRTAPVIDPDDDLDVETPEADAAEQRADVLPPDDEPVADPADEAVEADPADAEDQRRVVGPDADEDEYR